MPEFILISCCTFGLCFQEMTVAEGTIKKLTEKGFGFISTDENKDVFFHMSAVREVSFEELFEGQRVTYEEEEGPKGPRAAEVKPA